MSVSRIFVANRGEIALRVLRTARDMGLETVIGVSKADVDGLPAHMADRAVVLGPAQAGRSYLNVDLVLHAAKSTGCDALHPGYGFLSEKPELARRCAEEGITFIGPRPETIEDMGDKLSAIAVARAAKVATVPGTDMIDSATKAAAAAEELGYPVVMKASAGGGGKGMFPRPLVGRSGKRVQPRHSRGPGRLWRWPSLYGAFRRTSPPCRGPGHRRW